ncbi:hypothetical protein Bca4012_052838 [Brassica carinata]
MQSVWKLPSRASAPSPSPSSAGDSPPPHPIPPDPPDPLSPLSPQEYPLLSSTPLSKQKRNTVSEPLKKGYWFSPLLALPRFNLLTPLSKLSLNR